MKRIIGLIVLAVLLCINGTQAQSYNTKSLGVSTGYLFDSENVHAGIFIHLPVSKHWRVAHAGIFIHLPVSKHWRVAPSINYAFSNHDRYELDINGDVHYLVPFAGRFSFYPLAGIAFQSWRGNALQSDKELSNTVNKFGINAGAGFEMNLSRRLDLHIEGKYIFIDKFHQANLSIGLGYKF